jgi:hypothetical protein
MKRKLALALIACALLGLATLAAYNAYASYLTGRDLCRVMEADAAQTHAVLALGTGPESAPLESALAACSRSLESHARLRRGLESIESKDLEPLRRMILDFLDLEDMAVESKREFYRGQLDLHGAEELLARMMSRPGSLPDTASFPITRRSAATAEILRKVELLERSAARFLDQYGRAVEAEAALCRAGTTAGLAFPAVFVSLEAANRRHVQETLAAEGYPDPSAIAPLLTLKSKSRSGGVPPSDGN